VEIGNLNIPPAQKKNKGKKQGFVELSGKVNLN
jgi:hypothetical protein